MLSPDQFRTSPIVVGFIGFVIIFSLFGLGGCENPLDQPQKICAVYGEPYLDALDRTDRDCLDYQIGCLAPLILDSKDGKLFCRLRDAGERSDPQG